MAGMPFQAHPRRERVWADPDMCAILSKLGLVGGGSFGYFSRREKSDSRTCSV